MSNRAEYHDEIEDIDEAIMRLHRAGVNLSSDWLAELVEELTAFRTQIIQETAEIGMQEAHESDRFPTEDEYNA